MEAFIIEKANRNIGALCGFLKNVQNVEYLNYINSNIPDSVLDYDLSEKVWYLVNKSEVQLCDCGERLSFKGFKHGYRETCGKKECYIKKRKETCIEKYGVDNPKKSKEVLDREKEGIKNKWGGKHYMYNKEVVDKFKSTMLEKHGVEWAQQSKEISDKSVKTFRENDNRDEIIQKRSSDFKNKSSVEKEEILLKKKETIISDWGSIDNYNIHVNEQIKLTSLIKYRVDHFFSYKEVIDKRVSSYKENITNKIINKIPENISYVGREYNKNNTDLKIKLKCRDCGNIFTINRQYLNLRIQSVKNPCLICNPILSGKSNMEIEVSEFIQEYYNGAIILNSKSIIDKEIDIYLPEIKVAFEFNGLYWHSEEYKDKLYHLNKTKECLNHGISLFHIWGDDWTFKQDIVKSMIINKLGKTPNRIYARKCIIREVSDNKLIRDFLDKNHIQGFVGSKIKLGLFYNGELVSLMTFGDLRKSLGSKSQAGSYEMLRFCNKLNTNIIGGASKIFTYFIKNYQIREVISYSDSSRSEGNLYKQLGFELLQETAPNYYWIIDNIRHNRFVYRKDVLVKNGADSSKTEVQIMHESGSYRIWNCGNKKWSFKLI